MYKRQGVSDAKGTDDFVLVRLDPNGAIDLSFGKEGKVVLNLGGTETLYALSLQSNGYMLAAGVSDAKGTDDFVLVRFDPNGAIDLPFGKDGVVILDLGGDDAIHALSLQSDGKVVVMGDSDANGTDDVALVRHHP